MTMYNNNMFFIVCGEVKEGKQVGHTRAKGNNSKRGIINEDHMP
jgi:hypothetical protein